MTKVQRLQKENADLRDELECAKRDYVRLHAYYRRANAAAESLIRDVVTFMGPGGLVPHSIWGGRLLVALGKASALLHGTDSRQG